MSKQTRGPQFLVAAALKKLESVVYSAETHNQFIEEVKTMRSDEAACSLFFETPVGTRSFCKVCRDEQKTIATNGENHISVLVSSKAGNKHSKHIQTHHKELFKQIQKHITKHTKQNGEDLIELQLIYANRDFQRNGEVLLGAAVLSNAWTFHAMSNPWFTAFTRYISNGRFGPVGRHRLPIVLFVPTHDSYYFVLLHRNQ